MAVCVAAGNAGSVFGASERDSKGVCLVLTSSFCLSHVQDSSLRVHSSENVSLNARNENGDVTERISVGTSQEASPLMHGGDQKVISTRVLQQSLSRH